MDKGYVYKPIYHQLLEMNLDAVIAYKQFQKAKLSGLMNICTDVRPGTFVSSL